MMVKLNKHITVTNKAIKEDEVLANVRNMKDNFLVEGMNMLDGGDQM
jgi:hypothetical protein